METNGQNSNTGFTFPAANALTGNLNGNKRTVDVEAAEVNPLTRDLDSRPKHKAEAEPAAHQEEPATGKAEKPSASGGAASENPSGPSGAGSGTGTGTGKPYEKPLGNYSKTAEKLIKGWDQLASRILKHIAKDEFRDRWQLSKKEQEELMEWVTESCEFYNVTVSNPLYGVLYTLGLIYWDKGNDAWEARQFNERLAKKEEEIKYWRDKAEGRVTEREVDELLAKMRNTRAGSGKTPTQAEATAKQDTKTTTRKRKSDYDEVEVVLIDEDEEPGEEELLDNERETAQRMRQEQQQVEEEEFGFAKQVERQFFAQSGQNGPQSTAETVENSTLKNNGQRLNSNFNAAQRNKPTVETGFAIQPDAENIARGPDGKLEAFQPVTGDKRNRQTEVVRCPITAKLFERFYGQDKTFINHEAKNRYHYLVKCDNEGKVPKGGFPDWWNSG